MVVYASLFGVGAPEALVIGVVALLVFGPKGLAEVSCFLPSTAEIRYHFTFCFGRFESIFLAIWTCTYQISNELFKQTTVELMLQRKYHG